MDEQVLRILVVEDDAMFREIIESAIAHPTHDIVSVESGEAALVVLENWMPHVMLTDIGLGGIDGLETARRARERFADLWIVLMSGRIDANVYREFEPGVSCLPKPFELDDLDRILDEAKAGLGTLDP